MSRVTASEVKEIMDTCTVLDATVDVFINTANILVTQALSDASLTDELLKEIERWFTAHMLASTVARTASEEKIEDVQVKYTGKWGYNLDGTSYGQMVKLLDTSGNMAKLGKKLASMYAVKSFE